VERGAVTVGLAPGLLVHSRNRVVKLGVLVPVATREESRSASVRVSVKLLF
jgi:hypothetical protein